MPVLSIYFSIRRTQAYGRAVLKQHLRSLWTLKGTMRRNAMKISTSRGRVLYFSLTSGEVSIPANCFLAVAVIEFTTGR
jgi:hypothetical protein